MGFKSAGSGGGGFTGAGGGKSSAPHKSHGVFGLFENFGKDVKDAVTGIPTGAVMTVEHPIRAGKLMARASWHDWKPLLEGHPIAFAKQTYDHPLAPLLDVATVFSAGAGLGAKVGAGLSEAGMGGKLAESAAKLGKGSSRLVHDPTRIGEGTPLVKTYGDSAAKNLRRHLANRALLNLEPHLPAWFKESAREKRLYSKLQVSHDAHNMAAKNLQIDTLMKASKVMNDPAAQKFVQPALLTHNYANFRWHATKVGLDHVLAPGERYVINPLLAAKKLKYDPMSPDFAKRMHDFGRDFTSENPEHADVNGQRLVIRTDAIKHHGAEAEASTKFVRGLLPNATKWWKRIQVGYAPRVITNNAVGNWFMHATRTLGNGGGRSVIDAIRHAHGERAAMKAFKDMHGHIVAEQGSEQGAKFLAAAHPALHGSPDLASIEHAFGKRAADAVKRPPNWAKQFFSDELGNVFGNVLKDGEHPTSKLGKAAQQGLYPLVERVADRPVRVAALYQFMRRAPEVKAFLKTHPGAKLDDAIHAVVDKNPGHLRERAVQHVRSIAGDYTTMGPTERLIQNIVPFYLWDKHIAKHMVNMVGEKPGRVAIMQNLSRMGNDEQTKLLGKLPGFMGNSLPLSLLGMHNHNGRTPLLMTTGLNPYSTVGELADTATALTTRHDLQSGGEAASQLSPLLTGLVEQISGHKIGSQAPAPSFGGVIPSVLAGTASGTSYGTLIKRLVEGTPKPKVDSHGNSKPFMYAKTAGETASGLFGLPVKDVNLDAAHAFADKQDGTKKKKKRSTGYGG